MTLPDHNFIVSKMMSGKTFSDLKVDNFEAIVKNLDPPDNIALGKVLRDVLSVGVKDHCNHSASFWSRVNYCPSKRDVEDGASYHFFHR